MIIPVKKGLYVFGPDYAQKPYSRELLANLIYGPYARKEVEPFVRNPEALKIWSQDFFHAIARQIKMV